VIQPGIVSVRAIYDTNKNGIWDTGNFLEKLQPEEVIYYPSEYDFRANWDYMDEIFNLSP
jgi:hypothetical protein